MNNAISKTQNTEGQYTFVISTDDVLYPSEDWAHDPDITAVADISRQYWKWDNINNIVIEMTQAEKDIVDDYGTLNEVDTSSGPITIKLLDNLPKSALAGNPLAVHASYKPSTGGKSTYAVWSGAGDDMTDPLTGNGKGPLLHIQTEIGVPVSTVDIEFNRIYGRVWLHEAYIKFTNGDVGDSISSVIIARPVPLQQSVGLDLIIDGDWIKYSTGGPGTGTHGFADPTGITLVDREFNMDGDWNYTDEALTPNFTGTGRYKMSHVEKVVHQFVNRIPTFGTCATYVPLSSNETIELRPGYFARVEANNVSNTVWNVSVLMELYRELTYSS